MRRYWLLILLLTAAPWSHADVHQVPFEELVPNKAQVRSTRLITQVIDRYHYRSVALNDALSEQIFNRYLDSLDPNRSFFLQSDIDGFAVYRTRLDDALRDAHLGPAFKIFRTYRSRLQERVTYAIGLLDSDFDFTVDEDYLFDRSEEPWPMDHRALNEIWRQRVKNDVLNLRLAGKAESEIQETLRKRYETLGRQGGQYTSEDVYQLFINAYTLSIGPHTNYFSPRATKNFKINMSLSLEGIGAALRTVNEYTVVQRIIPGGPADLSGLLHADDRIVGVGQGNGDAIVDVVGWRLSDIVELIRGPKGTVVQLEVLPKGTGPHSKVERITIVRDKIKLEEQAAKKSVIEVGEGSERTRIGVIDVPTFYMDFDARARGEKNYHSTSRDVRRLLAELEAEGVDGVVIDLRGNGGGSLAEALALTGLFLESGAIVQVKDTSGKVRVNRDPDPNLVYSGPLAVLVDRNSASASEIFAGAIQDYRRGIIVGEPTFGKGTVQTLVDLSSLVHGSENELGQLKVTVAQFFRVSGGSTQFRGVVPDIIYPTTAAGTDKHGESALDNALPWASVQPASYKASIESAQIFPKIRDQHEQRVKGDPGFDYLLVMNEKVSSNRDRKQVSLLESRRKRERAEDDQQLTAYEQRYHRAQGFESSTAEEDEAESDTDAPGAQQVLVDEAARILADYIALRGSPPHGAPGVKGYATLHRP